jgi:hypothetical protein
MLFFGLVWGGGAIAQNMDAIPADEMSSVEWRDCAAHFYFLHNNLVAEAGENPAPDMKNMIEEFNIMATMAIYAGEYKAAAEASAGAAPPLAKSLSNPQTNTLNVDVNTYIERHTEMAVLVGREAYVQKYASKCAKPLKAFINRYANAMEQ